MPAKKLGIISRTLQLRQDCKRRRLLACLPRPRWLADFVPRKNGQLEQDLVLDEARHVNRAGKVDRVAGFVLELLVGNELVGAMVTSA